MKMYAVDFKVNHNTYFSFENAVIDYRGRIEYENDKGNNKYIEGIIVFDKKNNANEFINNNAGFLYISKYREI